MVMFPPNQAFREQAIFFKTMDYCSLHCTGAAHCTKIKHSSHGNPEHYKSLLSHTLAMTDLKEPKQQQQLQSLKQKYPVLFFCSGQSNLNPHMVQCSTRSHQTNGNQVGS